ncbi:MAG: hypothetical protein ACOH2M_27165 [Cypionkella sp.]
MRIYPPAIHADTISIHNEPGDGRIFATFTESGMFIAMTVDEARDLANKLQNAAVLACVPMEHAA